MYNLPFVSMKVSKSVSKEEFEAKAFFTIDSEGYTDESGMSHLTLIAIYSNHKGIEYYKTYTGDMKTQRILRWIDKCYKEMIEIYKVKSMEGIIFGGNYDFTLWLKDLKYNEVLALLDGNKVDSNEKAEGGLVYVMNHFYIGMAMGKFLRIRQFKGHEIWISDIIGITNMSFVNSLIAIGVDIPKDDLDRMAAEKTQRGNFTAEVTDEIIEYNRQELKYLYQMIVKIHTGLAELGWYPKHIYGVGAVASYLLGKNEIDKENFYLTLEDLDPKIQRSIIRAAEQSFFGGYIAAFMVGTINQRVWHYDLHSAYPSKMVNLPALYNGVWEQIDNPSIADVMNASMVSLVKVKVTQIGALKNRPTLPVRYRSKVFYSDNADWNYNVEFVKVLLKYRDYYDVKLETLWNFIPATDRKPFKFIQEISDMKTNTSKKELVKYRLLKIGMNSSYGKLIQTLGGDKTSYPAFYNVLYAAAITGATRAQILDAVLHIGIENACLAMTDSVFSIKPLPEELIGDELGQFGEEDKIKSMTIVQTGLYFYETLEGELEFKHRGVDFPLHGSSVKEIAENIKYDEKYVAQEISKWLKFKYLRSDMEFKHKKHFRKLTFGRTPKGYQSIGKWEQFDEIGEDMKNVSIVKFLLMGGFKEFNDDNWRNNIYRQKRSEFDLSIGYLQMGVHPLSQEWYLQKDKVYGHVAPWLSTFNGKGYEEALELQESEQNEREDEIQYMLASIEGL